MSQSSLPIPNLQEVIGFNLHQYCKQHHECSAVCWIKPDLINFKHEQHFTMPVYSYNRFYSWNEFNIRFKTSKICAMYPEYLETIKKFARRRGSINNNIDQQQQVCQDFLQRNMVNVYYDIKQDDIVFFKNMDGSLQVYLMKQKSNVRTCLQFEVSKCVIGKVIEIDVGRTLQKKMVVFKSISLVELYAEQFIEQSWGLINLSPLRDEDADGDIVLQDINHNNNNNNNNNNDLALEDNNRIHQPLVTESKQNDSMIVNGPILFQIYSQIGQALFQQNLLLIEDRSKLFKFHKDLFLKKILKWMKTKFVGEKHMIFQIFPVSIVNEFKYKGIIPYQFESIKSKTMIENFFNKKLENETKYVTIRLARYQLSLMSKFKIKFVFNIIYYDKIQNKWFPYFTD